MQLPQLSRSYPRFPAAAALVGTLLTGAALCQVAMPPHTATYNGFSRGWSTTAQTGFVITQLDLPVDAMQPGDTGAFLITVNGTAVHHSSGNATLPLALASSILVAPGDVLRVVGNYSPAAPGQFTAHNSYASGGGTYMTPIEGVPHTLFRAGQQWDVGDPAYAGTGFEGVGGSIGRVIIHTAPLTGFASETPYGTGCYDSPRMVYEQFPGGTAPIDLINTATTLLYQPDPSTGGTYAIIPGIAPYDPTVSAATAVDLKTLPPTSSSSASWDDGSITRALPFALTFPSAGGGGSTMDITVNSNGKIYLGITVDTTFATNGANYASLAPFQGSAGAGLPVLSPFNCDLDPVAGGNIWYEDPSPSGGVRITWANVPNWNGGLAVAFNDIQLELLPGGIVNFAYGPSLGNGGSTSNDAIVGFSAGNGEAVSTPVDWSALAGYMTGNGAIPLALDAASRPVLGTTFSMTVDNIPAGSPFVGVIYGLTKYDPGLDLTSIGMAGCLQYTSMDTVHLGIGPGASFTDSFPIPSAGVLIGLTMLSQAAAYNPTAIPNLLGALSSNGVELVLDVL